MSLPAKPDKNTLILMAALALLFLPFCGKAFHIDDIGFLQLSRQLTWNPLIPMTPTGHSIYESTHPLLLPYLYKILITLFGENEVVLHLVFLIFPSVALFSFRSLNRTLFQTPTGQEMVPLLLFCSLPAFLVNAQTLMADVPTLAFVLLALACYASALEKGLPKLCYLGGSSLALAIFISYQSAVFIPLIFLYSFVKKKVSPHFLLSLGIAPGILLIWLLSIYQRYDIFPFLKSRTTQSIGTVVQDGLPAAALQGKFIYILAMTGASTLLLIVLCLFAQKRVRGALMRIPLLFLVSFFATSSAATDYDLFSRVLLSLLTTAGIYSLGIVFWRCLLDIRLGETRSRGLLLLTWISAVLLYNLFLLPFGSARYLLPALPPILMVLFNGNGSPFPYKRAATVGVVLFSLFFGLSTALADYFHAESYRSMASEVRTFRDKGGKAFDVWFVGDWGMHYYMQKAGVRLLSSTSNEPKRGDFVVLPEMPRFWVPSQLVQNRWSNYAVRDFNSGFPLHLFNRRSKAGFYSHIAGLLPFTFSYTPNESFTILEMVR